MPMLVAMKEPSVKQVYCGARGGVADKHLGDLLCLGTRYNSHQTRNSVNTILQTGIQA